ncbi:hypothetical protein B0H14DRAFT_2807460 [Mycena olivaceomarginata]|nr:hypothetical protein B0H14DRAFT_2807460 [Mycena olivaceomarginata]
MARSSTRRTGPTAQTVTGWARSLLSLASVLADRVPVLAICVLGTEQSLISSEAGPEDHLKHGHWTENGALTI